MKWSSNRNPDTVPEVWILFSFYPLFEGEKRFFKDFFQKILPWCIVSIQERFLIKNSKWTMSDFQPFRVLYSKPHHAGLSLALFQTFYHDQIYPQHTVILHPDPALKFESSNVFTPPKLDFAVWLQWKVFVNSFEFYKIKLALWCNKSSRIIIYNKFFYSIPFFHNIIFIATWVKEFSSLVSNSHSGHLKLIQQGTNIFQMHKHIAIQNVMISLIWVT